VIVVVIVVVVVMVVVVIGSIDPSIQHDLSGSTIVRVVVVIASYWRHHKS